MKGAGRIATTAFTLTVPDEMACAAEHLARATGTTAEQVLVRALAAHFPPVSPELAAVLAAWDLASDEDMARLGTHLAAYRIGHRRDDAMPLPESEG